MSTREPIPLRVKMWLVVLLVAFLLAALNDTRTIQEDDPGWNCQTMGNRICGADN